MEKLTTFQIQQEKFTGPLDLLLNLIEEKKLEITEISLAKVTDEFLSYVGDLKKVEPAILADFLVIATKLLLIKSRYLLPELILSPEEEKEIKDLTLRLEIYRSFKEAEKNIKNLYGRKPLYAREFLFNQTPTFYPPANISINDLFITFQKIWEEFQKIGEFSIEKIKKIVKIEEKIQQIVEILNQRTKISFNKLVKKETKLEIIITFLALLQLIKDQLILVEQEEEFGEIRIISKNKLSWKS